MRTDGAFPSWRHRAARATRLVPLVLLLAPLALLGGTRTALAGGPDQQAETKIEIRISGTISAAQREQIDELMAAFEGQNPRLKIKAEKREREHEKGEKEESKAEKYLFFPLTAAMLGIVAALTVLAQGWRKARAGINPIGNVATAAAFGLVAASGFLLIFGVKFKDEGLDLKFWHVVIGTVFVYLILFHVVNNWRAWLAYLRRAIRWVGSASS